MTELQAHVLAQISEEECTRLIEELVPIGQPECANSLDPDVPSGREEQISLAVAGKLQQLGLQVELKAALPGRPNVIGRLRGTGGGPSVILNDHLDTYPSCDPAEWTMTGGDPFRPTTVGRRIYARGTSDTRGNLATQLIAVQALRRAGVPFKGDLAMVYTVDEERNGRYGSQWLLEQEGLRADYAIIAEPTSWTDGDQWGMNIAVGHCGHVMLRLETCGTRSHLWRPDVGVNAIMNMSRLLAELDTLAFSHDPPVRYGSTRPQVCVVAIQAGEPGEKQFTPAVCRATIFVVGLVPGMTLEGIRADIQQVIARLHAADAGFEATVSPVEGPFFVEATQEVPAGASHLQALIGAYRTVLGSEPRVYRKNAFCDTIRFSHAGIPALTFGPGEDGWPPTNEYIHLDKVVAAAKIYALALLELLGAAGDR